MFVAMNRFRIARGSEAAFEKVWADRDSHLEAVPGFRSFHLLKGSQEDDHTLYATHTVWDDESAFRAWTQSEAFRLAHRNAGDNRSLYLGPPKMEGFTSVLGETAGA